MPLTFDEGGVISRSPAETELLAAEFYELAEPDGLAALYGPLGAGKTAFVRGVARAAGVDPTLVGSPSFTFINEYGGGRTPLYHFDLFRLKNPEEIFSLGADDYFNRPGLILIEWADRGGPYIPRPRYEIFFEIVDDSSRHLTFNRPKS